MAEIERISNILPTFSKRTPLRGLAKSSNFPPAFFLSLLSNVTVVKFYVNKTPSKKKVKSNEKKVQPYGYSILHLG